MSARSAAVDKFCAHPFGWVSDPLIHAREVGRQLFFCVRGAGLARLWRVLGRWKLAQHTHAEGAQGFDEHERARRRFFARGGAEGQVYPHRAQAGVCLLDTQAQVEEAGAAIPVHGGAAYAALYVLVWLHAVCLAGRLARA